MAFKNLNMINYFKKSIMPVKNGMMEKYAEMRYESTHRDFNIIHDKEQPLRLNLIVPTIESKDVFGGVSTALKIFINLYQNLECEARIITMNSFKEMTDAVPDSFKDIQNKSFIIETVDIQDSNISLRKNDIFMVTFWSTALIAEKLIYAQLNKYRIIDPILVYLIQDFEPGFYPWSTEYVEAERTYHFPFKTLAVFNSKELKIFFENNNYSFFEQTYFSPVLNDSLKKRIDMLDHLSIRKKKQILIYGRPQEYRNAYTLIIDALKKFSYLIPECEAKEWEIISLGAKHKNITFHNGLELKSYGKVSLEDYSKIMLSSFAGISLMISPHPSYPPLEMSTHGVKTITNSFSNKDLSNFNEFIVSLDTIGSMDIANKLFEIVNNYNDGNVTLDLNEKYISNNLEFDNLTKYISEIIS